MSWHRFRVVCPVVLLAASLALPAKATVWTGLATVSIGGVDPGWLIVSIPGFDPDRGPIVSASVTVEGMLQASVVLDPAASASPGGMFDNAVQLSPMNGSVALGSVRAERTGPSTMSERVPISVTGALPADYAATAQPGSLDLGLFFETLLDAPGAQPQSQTLNFTGRVAASVTFADPVAFGQFSAQAVAAPAALPEPATAALVGAGLLAAGIWARRRR